MTYALVLGLVGGTLVSAFAEFAAADFQMDEGQRPISLRLKPFYALADATGSSQDLGSMGVPSILTPFAATLPNSDTFGVVTVDDRDEPIDDGLRPPGGWSDLVWPQTLVLYLLLAALALLIATRSIGPRDGVRET